MSKEIKLYVHCPNCGEGSVHFVDKSGKSPRTNSREVPNRVQVPEKVGLILGKNFGDKFDKPQCPKCGIKFSIEAGMEPPKGPKTNFPKI